MQSEERGIDEGDPPILFSIHVRLRRSLIFENHLGYVAIKIVN
jgi:hypothetical protein